MTSEQDHLKVTFFPPLYLQRRIWVLNVLRREDITSVSTPTNLEQTAYL